MGWNLSVAGRVGAAVLAATSLAGCWLVPGQGPNRGAHNVLEDIIGVDTVGSLTEQWRAGLDVGAAGDPVRSPHGVHVVDDRSAYGLALDAGTRRWEYELEGATASMLGQAWVKGNELLVSFLRSSQCLPDGVYGTARLDAATGERLPGDLNAAVGSVRGRDELSYALTSDSTCSFLRPSVSVVDDDMIFCCVPTFVGPAVAPAPVPPLPGLTLGSSWIFHSGHGVVGSGTLPPSGNGLRAYELSNRPSPCPAPAEATLCPKWAVPFDGTTATAPVLSDDETVAYVGTDAGSVYAVATATGTVIWRSPVGAAVTDSPALAQGSLFVPTASGDLVVLDALTGLLSWRGQTGSEVTQQPAVAGGVVFTGSADGTVAAFDAAGCGASSCPTLWSRTAGSRITGAPAVSAGHLYVGTATGEVIAYGL